jgi:hypothetical protein
MNTLAMVGNLMNRSSMALHIEHMQTMLITIDNLVKSDGTDIYLK